MCRTIVIADDEPITRINIAEMLEGEGYKVVGQAVDGFDAVELCRKHHPDMVILDVKMPLLDGLMAAKIINEEKLAGGIIILTAYSGREFIDKAKENCVLNYIIKPIAEKTFLLAVEIAINQADEMKRIKDETVKANERLEARVYVDRAKSRLITKENMSEDEAYNYIRKLSMEKRCSMMAIAKILLMND
jgi:response regulator NasT